MTDRQTFAFLEASWFGTIGIITRGYVAKC